MQTKEKSQFKILRFFNNKSTATNMLRQIIVVKNNAHVEKTMERK